MKKVLLSAALLGGMLFGANAQDEAAASSSSSSIGAGNIYLSGLVNYTSGSEKNADGDQTYKSGNFGIVALPGYMVSDQIGVHLLVGYGSASEDIDPENDGGKETLGQFNIGLGAKYFMGSNKFYFSPALNFVYGSGTFKDDNNADLKLEKVGTMSSIDIYIEPAFTYFFSDKISGELSVGRLGYNSNSYKDADGEDAGSDGEFEFNFDLLSQVGVGFTYWIK